MVDRVLALPERTRLYLLAPVVRGRKGEYRKEIADYMKRGFQRLKIDGQFYEIAEAPALDKKLKHDIEVVVDRIAVRADMAARLAESFETALELADGIAIIEYADEKEARRQTEADRLLVEIRLSGLAASRSRRSSRGSSPSTIRSAPARPAAAWAASRRSIPSSSCPIRSSPCARARSRPGRRSTSPYYLQTLELLAKHYKFRLDTPFEDLPERVQRDHPLWFGRGADPLFL